MNHPTQERFLRIKDLANIRKRPLNPIPIF